ncbi:unnamed protein product, partial [Cuscuta europaea]
MCAYQLGGNVPGQAFFKVNVDGALDFGQGERAWGWIIPDGSGNFVSVGSVNCTTDWPVHVTEAFGLRELFSWAKAQRWNKVEVETDASLITSRLEDDSGESYFDLIIDDIRHMPHGEANMSIIPCKQSSNRVAHTLARAALSKADDNRVAHILVFPAVWGMICYLNK